jgi:hypothetical protein
MFEPAVDRRLDLRELHREPVEVAHAGIGIGRGRARKLRQHFLDDALDLLQGSPQLGALALGVLDGRENAQRPRCYWNS